MRIFTFTIVALISFATAEDLSLKREVEWAAKLPEDKKLQEDFRKLFSQSVQSADGIFVLKRTTGVHFEVTQAIVGVKPAKEELVFPNTRCDRILLVEHESSAPGCGSGSEESFDFRDHDLITQPSFATPSGFRVYIRLSTLEDVRKLSGYYIRLGPFKMVREPNGAQQGD